MSVNPQPTDADFMPVWARSPLIARTRIVRGIQAARRLASGRRCVAATGTPFTRVEIGAMAHCRARFFMALRQAGLKWREVATLSGMSAQNLSFFLKRPRPMPAELRRVFSEEGSA